MAANRWRLVLAFLLIGLLHGYLGPATAGSDQSDRIDELRARIRQLEQQLKEQQSRESETLEMIETLDQKISLTKNLLLVYRREIEGKRAAIDSLTAQRADLVKKQERLRNMIARRMVSQYKYGNLSTIEMLLDADSFQTLRLWLEYQRRLNENDARMVRSFRQRQKQLQQTQAALEQALQEQLALLKEKEQEERALQADLQARKAMLETIRRDRRLYEQQIEDYQKAIEEIQRLIATSERVRREQQTAQPEGSGAVELSDFAQLHGRLPWPVRGEVVRPYGPYRHPVLKTVTQNLGIDIRVAEGTEVHAVAAGRVTAISWQRGRGNLIIVNHGNGYYTVYTHIDEIYVTLQQEVVTGDVLGRVGKPSTAEFPVLHFQVWHQFEHQDPMEWLSR